MNVQPNGRTVVVTGANGQDGFYLVSRLLDEGTNVHATVRDAARSDDLVALPGAELLTVHELDLADKSGFSRLIADLQPAEFFNLAGHSSVFESFREPTVAWLANAHAVEGLLEAIRLHSPSTVFYQSSSTDMFGSYPGRAIVHDESSQFMPQSPYAAAKAAAHLLCDAYRRAFDLRIACGILSNHESRRRPSAFLTRKVVDHVQQVGRRVSAGHDPGPPLLVGNLAAQRDWGFAPDYVEGMLRVARQVSYRAKASNSTSELDAGSNYRDYILASGQLHAVWELVDRAFELAGLPLEWKRKAADAADWSARLAATGADAVVVDRRLIRPSDPIAISANPARAREELGWEPRPGLDVFLTDMLGDQS